MRRVPPIHLIIISDPYQIGPAIALGLHLGVPVVAFTPSENGNRALARAWNDVPVKGLFSAVLYFEHPHLCALQAAKSDGIVSYYDLSDL